MKRLLDAEREKKKRAKKMEKTSDYMGKRCRMKESTKDSKRIKRRDRKLQ